MIKILHLVASSRGGGATHVRDLALGLPRDRYACSVAMPEDGGTVHAADFISHGVDFHPLTSKMQIRRMATQVDILHCHSARAAFWGRLMTMALGAKRPKIVYTIHGLMIPHYPFPRRLLLTIQEKMQAFQVNQFVAVSNAERDGLLRTGIANGHDIQVVRYGINLEAFEKSAIDGAALRSAFGISPDNILVTMICRFFWPRDFPTLLHAFHQAAIHAPYLRLLLVGDGPWRPQIETLLDDLDLRGRVIMPGARVDVADLLHISDIFVLTSSGGDGLPISILEAMAAGLPVIATASDGIPEEVFPGETGLLAPLRDVATLAEAMVKLAQDSDMRHSMGMAGQRRAHSEFAREQMVTAMMKVYDSVLSSDSKSQDEGA